MTFVANEEITRVSRFKSQSSGVLNSSIGASYLGRFSVALGRVTNLLTLNLCHGGSVVFRGRFGKRNAAASAACVDERQGAGVVACFDAPRAADRARGPRLPTSLGSRVFPPRFPGGVRTSSEHCSANSGRSTRGLGRNSSACLSALLHCTLLRY